MDRYNVVKILRYLGAYKFNFGDDYVQGNCPFAKARHKSGIDRNPSFSISIGNISVYHCFSCGVKGRLSSLPNALSIVYKKDFRKLSKFISMYEKPLLEEKLPTKDKTIVVIPLEKLNAFTNLTNKWKYIQPSILSMYSIKYYEDTIIIPIFLWDKNTLVGLKYRNEREFWTEGKFKQYGAFFGMQIPLDKKKALFIVEGERDVMLLKQYGITNIWGISGQLSKEQVTTLKQIDMPIVIFTDNDNAGELYFAKLMRALSKLKEVYYVKDYFGCKDPAELYEQGLLGESLKSISSVFSMKTLTFFS